MRAYACLFFVAALIASGCVKRVGKGIEDFPVANSPAGLATTVTVRTQGTIAGELLEVRDTAVVLRRDTEVLLVPNASIVSLQFQGGDLRMHSLTPDEFRRGDLRLLSRYPSGITPAVMAALLAASGRSEPTIVPR